MALALGNKTLTNLKTRFIESSSEEPPENLQPDHCEQVRIIKPMS